MRARALVAWNLRRIRVERGVTQEILAFETGIDRAYTSGLEREAYNPTIDLLERLTNELNVPMSELFVLPPKGSPAPKTLPKGRKAKKAKPRAKKQ